MSVKEILITGNDLSIENIHTIAMSNEGEAKVVLDQAALGRMKKSRAYVHEIVSSGKTVYGINTGFGALADTKIATKDLEALQVNLIRSHCTGVGRPFSKPITRAIMLLRANCLAVGHSGVNPRAVELLLTFLNHHVTPVVPEKGSVGASGDLAPLSHIALALIGEGDVEYHGKIVNSGFVLHQIGEEALSLGPKDGLALINGTAAMAALGSLAIYEAEILARVSDIAGALTLEGVRGTSKAFHPGIQKLKPHAGQIAVADNLRRLLSDSPLMDSHTDCGKVQDPYSLRCMPQVHGACRQTLNHTRSVMETELNAVTDNPLIFPETDEVISGGNFHGEAIAMAMDYLAIGLAEFCSMSERRIEKLINPIFSGLPAFLAKDSGLNSGFMIAHVTAAALTSENKIYCHPASVDSIPTSTDKEDHVSMGVTSGRKLQEVVDNLRTCLSIELLCAAQAINFLRPLKTTPPLEAVHQLIRKHVTPMDVDRVISRDIDSVRALIASGEILKVVHETIGELQ